MTPRLPASEAAIKACALDYIEGWYSGDPVRMARCLHPDLAKRVVERPEAGQATLRSTSTAQMIEWARAGRGKGLERADWAIEVNVLDQHDDMASVKVSSARVIDYLHLARFGDDWKIVNVLWKQR